MQAVNSSSNSTSYSNNYRNKTLTTSN